MFPTIPQILSLKLSEPLSSNNPQNPSNRTRDEYHRERGMTVRGKSLAISNEPHFTYMARVCIVKNEWIEMQCDVNNQLQLKSAALGKSTCLDLGRVLRPTPTKLLVSSVVYPRITVHFDQSQYPSSQLYYQRCLLKQPSRKPLWRCRS